MDNNNNYDKQYIYDHDSDNDQGFVPTKVQIKSDPKNANKQPIKNDPLTDRPIDFQGRYIFGDGIIRKQPIQIYARFKNYLHQLTNTHTSININMKQSIQNGNQKLIEQELVQEKQSDEGVKNVQLYNNSQNNSNNNRNSSNNINYNTIPTIQHTIQPKIQQQPQHTVKHPQKQTLSLKNIQPIMHPYQKFLKSQLYTLIYSRIKDKVCNFNPNNDDFTNNQINLSKVVGKYDADCYSVLKMFQYGGLVMEQNKDKKYKDKDYKQIDKIRQKDKQHIQRNYNYKKQQNLSYPYSASATQQQNQNNSQTKFIRIRSQINHSEHVNSYNPIHHHNNNTSHNSQTHHSLHNHHTHNSQTHPSSEQLQFDSKFQSGNLLYAFKHKIQTNCYYLFIQNDTNSYGYNQWFYFSLRNMKINVSYKFIIVNLRKKHSMFNEGMKIAVWSYIDSCQEQNQGNGWRKMGDNIRYQKSMIRKNSDKKFKFYSLSFQLKFKNEGDYVKIAMNVPYSYSRLIYHLKICQKIVKKGNQQLIMQDEDKIRSPPRKYSNILKVGRKGSTVVNNTNISKLQEKGIYWEMVPAGYSIANNAVPYVTITSNKNKPLSLQKQPKINQDQQPIKQSNVKEQQSPPNTSTKTPMKKVIILLSRQHPGQTWSSFLMQQFLYSLSQNKNESTKWLLQNYIFKIFPMVNVDGVIYGNFRCDIGGFDLNRNWRKPDKNLHLQIFAIKSQIQKIANQYKIQCVLDLHGHSKQYNTFSYACKNDAVSARILSLMISQINPIFHFPYCTFGLSKYKQTTARAVIYKLTGNQNILTIQNSFFAAKLGQKLLIYDPQVMRQISKAILQGVYQYFSYNKHRIQCQNKIRQNLNQYLAYQRIPQTPAVDSGSESEPYVDQISIKEKIKKILPKSFKALQQQLEQQQKSMKKKSSPTKKRQIQKKSLSTNQNHKTLNPSALKKRKRTQQEQLDQTFIQRNSLTHYKRNSRQLPSKKQTLHPPIQNTISQQTNRPSKKQIQIDNNSSIKPKVGEVGLPFYIRQRSTLVPIKLKNDSLEIFKDAYNATKAANQYQSNLHKTFTKSSNKKVKILNGSKPQQQFPILCVLSQQKKRHSQFQKNNEIFNQKQIQKYREKERQKVGISLPPKVRTFVQNQKLQHLKKYQRQKNHSFLQNNASDTNNVYTNYNRTQLRAETITQRIKDKSKDASLISKIWRQNFARYGKDLNIFFGGMKGG